MSLSKALIINNISNAILMTLPAITAAAWKISTSSAHLNKNFAIRPRPHGSKQSSYGSRNNLSSKLRLRIGSSRHAWMDAMGTWSSIDTRRSNPGSTAIGTSTHHGKSTPSTNHRIASCITQEQSALRCARSIKAAYARACSRRTATITHDTTKHSCISILSTHPHTSRRL